MEEAAPSPTSDYTFVATVGAGAFGYVRRAVHLPTGTLRAVKTVFVRTVCADSGQEANLCLPHNLTREVNALRACAGPHVVTLHETFAVGRSIALALEHCEVDLRTVLRAHVKRSGRDASGISEAAAKAIAMQVLSATAHVHASGCLHRDIKAQNFLFTHTGRLKLCDFGLARPLQHGGRADDDVSKATGAVTPTAAGTRWYRSPELLFGARRYGAGNDVWAAACVCHEVADTRARLPCQGEADVHQLVLVAGMLGAPSPTEEERLSVCPDYGKLDLGFEESYVDEQASRAVRARHLLRGRRGGSYGRLRSMLVDAMRWTPQDRLTARDMLARAWFFVAPYALEEEEILHKVLLPAVQKK